MEDYQGQRSVFTQCFSGNKKAICLDGQSSWNRTSFKDTIIILRSFQNMEFSIKDTVVIFIVTEILRLLCHF